MALFLLLLISISVYIFYQFYWRRRNLPPGPCPLPFIGNLHQFAGKSVEEVQHKWWKQYGDVFTMWQGTYPVVVVSDYNLCVDLFVKDADACIGRGVDEDFFRATRGGIGGVLLTENERWKEQRRFALHVMKDLGVGKNLMQEKILEEALELHRRIDQASELEHEIAINDLIDISVGSVINCFLVGYRYTDDKLDEFTDLKKRGNGFMTITGNPVVLTMRGSGYVNILRHLPIFKEKFAEACQNSNYLIDFFRDRIAEYKKTRKEFGDDDSHEEPQDYVGAFMLEKKRRDKEGGKHYFDDDQLALMLFDMWLAGQETSSNTLGWGIVYLIHHPEIQQKIHEELDRVIGSDRLVTLSDKQDLPYMCAVVHETQRITNLAVINVMHKTTKDIKIRDYDIKKGTWIVPQVSLIMYDEKIFKDPRTFNPDRFFDASGKLKLAPEVLPFSLGKRACLGEGIARMELFLFLANLVNQYKFLPAKQMPSLVRRNAVSIRAEDFKCRVVKRFT